MASGVSIEDQLRSQVSRMMKEIEDAEAVLFATKEGLPLVFEARFNPDIVDRLAALSAMLFAVSRRTSDIVKMGNMNYMEVALDLGRLFLNRVNNEIFLVALTTPETNVGLVRLLMKEVSDKARRYLEKSIT